MYLALNDVPVAQLYPGNETHPRHSQQGPGNIRLRHNPTSIPLALALVLEWPLSGSGSSKQGHKGEGGEILT